ncbi:MAG: hypothetical protein ACRDH2_21210, partial [Anaerolineales bacterium]
GAHQDRGHKAQRGQYQRELCLEFHVGSTSSMVLDDSMTGAHSIGQQAVLEPGKTKAVPHARF